MRVKAGSITQITSRRRVWYLWLIAGLAAVSLGAYAFARLRVGHVERRQVILVIFDAARRDAFGCYGGESNASPNVDELAADGVRFETAISASSWTLPSVASMFTGTWPTVHGASGKGVMLRPIRDEIPTAAEVIRDAGIHTMAVANAAFFSPLVHVDRGFEEFDHEYTYNGDYRRARETADAALQLLWDHRAERNFLVVHFFDPHLDYGAPAPYTFLHTRGRTEPAPPLTDLTCRELAARDSSPGPASENVAYARRIYEGEVTSADAQLGRLLKRLRRLGMYDDSLIILVADHGEEFWDHGKFEHGHSLYDELIRVPLIVKYPKDLRPARRVVATQVRTVDLMPTVFETLGIEKPASFVGASLTPVATGQETADRDAFAEGTLYGPDRMAWRSTRYKCILTAGADGTYSEALFDWRADPGEQHDLTAAEPEIARQSRERLLDFHRGLLDRVRGMPVPAEVSLGQERIRMLRALGYLR